jgi:hypothetical protein
VSGQPHVLAALPPQKQPPAPVHNEAARAQAPEPVCKFRKTERSTVSDRIQTPDHHTEYAILTPPAFIVYVHISHSAFVLEHS